MPARFTGKEGVGILRNENHAGGRASLKVLFGSFMFVSGDTVRKPTFGPGPISDMMHQFRSARLLAVLFFACLFHLCDTQSVQAQYGKKKASAKKKPAPKSAPKTSKPAPPTEAAASPAPSGKAMKFIYGDVFVGPSMNFASGDYIDYQKLYYGTANPNFSITGTFKNQTYFTAGAQARVYPFRKPESPLSALSFTAGLSFLQKGFTHDVLLVNKSLDYTDETKLKEEFNASFLASHLMVRYGKRLYAEAGISIDWFLSGVRNQDLTRKSSGANAYQGAFETTANVDYNLTTKTMNSQSLGWVFGVGYQITDMFGVRFFNNLNSGFFKDSKLQNYQPSLQVTVSFP